MAEPHVVSALVTKRTDLGNHIERLQRQMREAVMALDNVEATLKLFAPDMNMAELEPRRVPHALPAVHGDSARVLFDTMRLAQRPITTGAITEAIMAARNLDTNDNSLCRLMGRRTNAMLKHWVRKGMVRGMPGPGQQKMWELTKPPSQS